VTEASGVIGLKRVIGGFGMRTQRMLLILAAGLAVTAVGYSAIAIAHAGGEGGSHGGVGFYGGGSGYRGGSHGRGGYRHRWFGGCWYGASGGLGYGLLCASLPLYYDTYWWDGVAYYYADDIYYRRNSALDGYETVQPPAGVVNQVQSTALVVSELFAYPKAGQSSEQQATDREDCHRWAVVQSGYNPRVATDASMGATPAANGSGDSNAEKRAVYLRADGALLGGRRYGVQ
jgi:hypothetical protein